jgi:DNA gyrase/topoisomerase IV subunit B
LDEIVNNFINGEKKKIENDYQNQKNHNLDIIMTWSIEEFVYYYKNLNINKIFLYDNNDINGEHFEGILSN